MKTKLLLIALCTALVGCVTARVEEQRTANTGIKSEEALVILGRASYNDRETEESFTDCLAEALSSGAEAVTLVDDKVFKDALYPWFEPRTAPTTSDELEGLFQQPGVAEQIQLSNVRYLAWIDGDTITVDRGGSFSCTISSLGGGCFGMSYWEEDASYEASIWDLQNLTTAGAISADANGTSYLAGLVLPVPILARPGNAACKALANQLRDFLVGSGG
jgi:hypothetical protein